LLYCWESFSRREDVPDLNLLSILLSILLLINLSIVSRWHHQTNSALSLFELFSALATPTNSLIFFRSQRLR
jgi:hypothetical protein